MFFKKKNFVRFYSVYPGVESIYPIKKSKHHKHTWLDNLSKDYIEKVEEQKTSKCPFTQIISTSKCPAIRDITRRGYIVYSPCDIKIITENNGENISWCSSYGFGDAPEMGPILSFHTPDSLLNLIDHRPDTVKYVLKINLPWRVECSDDIILLQSHLHYSSEGRFTTASGILDPKESNQINVQLFWHIMDGVEIIKAGTPLAQYIPIQRNFNPELIVDVETERDKNNVKKLNYISNHSLTRNHKLVRDYLNDTSN